MLAGAAAAALSTRQQLSPGFSLLSPARESLWGLGATADSPQHQLGKNIKFSCVQYPISKSIYFGYAVCVSGMRCLRLIGLQIQPNQEPWKHLQSHYCLIIFYLLGSRSAAPQLSTQVRNLNYLLGKKTIWERKGGGRASQREMRGISSAVKTQWYRQVVLRGIRSPAEVVEWLKCRTSEGRLGVRFPLRLGWSHLPVKLALQALT